MASYGVSLNECFTVLKQIVAIGRSSGLEEELKTLFQENGIVNGDRFLGQAL